MCCQYHGFTCLVIKVWCALLRLGRLADTAIRKQLQHCHRRLGQITVALLDVRRLLLAEQLVSSRHKLAHVLYHGLVGIPIEVLLPLCPHHETLMFGPFGSGIES